MTCKGCGLDKPEDEFHWADRAAGRREGKCKSCRSAQQARSYAARTATLEGRERVRASSRESARRGRRRSFGVTDEEYAVLVAAGNGRCWICRREPDTAGPNGRTLHMDHDHVTGELRGLLCTKCNTLLGMAGDDPTVLRRAIAYLNISQRPLRRRLATLKGGA